MICLYVQPPGTVIAESWPREEVEAILTCVCGGRVFLSADSSRPEYNQCSICGQRYQLRIVIEAIPEPEL